MLDELKVLCAKHGLAIEEISAAELKLAGGCGNRTLEVRESPGFFKYWLGGKVRSIPVTLANGKLETGERYRPDWHGHYTESGEITDKSRLLELALQWLVLGYEPEELPNRVRISFGIG